MVILIVAVKAFEKTQLIFDKNSQQVKNRVELPQFNKKHLQKVTANIIFMVKDGFFPEIKSKVMMSTYPSFIHLST